MVSFSKKYAIYDLEKYSRWGEKKKVCKDGLNVSWFTVYCNVDDLACFYGDRLGLWLKGKKERCQKSPFLYLNGIHLVDTPGKHWAYFLLPLFQFFHQLLGELHYMAPLAQVYKLKLLATHAFTKFLKEWVVHWKTPIIDYGTAIGCC